MKLTQLLLCKTPFTPSYEHLVTGCSSSEFYSKLSSQPSTQIISPVLTPNITFRPVRETDREIVFSLNMIGENSIYIKPQDFNYVATYEQNPTSSRFWFIDSYNVDNSGVYPTVTFYCSIDHYHSYCLDVNILEQTIIRDTQNERRKNDNQFISDDINIPHREVIVKTNHNRILWVRAKISLIEYNSPDLNIGSTLDGGLPDIYFPLALIDGDGNLVEDRCGIHTSGNHRHITIKKDTIKSEDIGSEEKYYSVLYGTYTLLSSLSSSPIVKEMSLTYIVPFDYTIDYYEPLSNLSVDVNYNNILDVVDLVSNNGYITGITLRASSEHAFDYTKEINIFYDNQGDLSEEFDRIEPRYKSWLYVYPYTYYSVHIGSFSLVVPYPIYSVKFKIKFGGSSSTFNCDIYINGNLVQNNISVPYQYPLPINTTQADVIDARYGSSFRELQYMLNTTRSIGAVTSSAQTMIGGVGSIVTGGMSFNPLIMGGGIFKTVGGGADFATAIYASQERDMILNAQKTTASTQYFPVSQADSVILGNYPFISKHIVDEHFISFCEDRIKKFGQNVYKLGNPFVMNHTFYDYKKCHDCRVVSNELTSLANEVISSVLNRGVHIWDYTKYEYIGNYSDINNEPLEV